MILYPCSTVNGYSSSSLIEMVGKGKLFILTDDDDVVNINELLEKHDLQPLKSSQGRIYTKATIKGKVYFSKEYTKATKTNSFTVSFTNFAAVISHGIVLNFVCVDGHHLATIQELLLQCTGPPQRFPINIITLSSQELLFEDYLTCKEGSKQYIFANQIIDKFCNLTNDNWILITSHVNAVEAE